jgi:hypothetical protein
MVSPKDDAKFKLIVFILRSYPQIHVLSHNEYENLSPKNLTAT